MAIVVKRSVSSANDEFQRVLGWVYPVGSYYETSDSNFNPNTTWIGTWTSSTSGQVIRWHRTA